MDEAMDWTRDTAQEAGRMASRNAVPVALVGIGATLTGIGLMLASDSAGRGRGNGEYGGYLPDRRVWNRGRGRLARAVDERPLATCAVALGIGAAIGLLLPETERENDWMGEARESVVSSAQQMARDTAGMVAGTQRDRRP
jgi:hypothetical protein